LVAAEASALGARPSSVASPTTLDIVPNSYASYGLAAASHGVSLLLDNQRLNDFAFAQVSAPKADLLLDGTEGKHGPRFEWRF